MPNESVPTIAAEYGPSKSESQPINLRKPFKVREPSSDPDKEASVISKVTSSFDELTQKLVEIKRVQDRMRQEGKEIDPKKLLTKTKMGQKASGNYIACLEALGIGYDIKAKPSRAQTEAIISLNRSLSRIDTDPNEKRLTLLGPVSEYATSLAVSESIKRLNLPVKLYTASPIEDLNAGTDIVLERADLPGVIPVQIKIMPLINQNKLLYPVDTRNSGEVMSDLVVNSKLQGDKKSDYYDDYLAGSIERLLSFQDPNVPVVGRGVLAVPSAQGDHPLFNAFNGIPSEDFVDQIGNELKEFIYPPEESARNYQPQRQSIGSILSPSPQRVPEAAYGDD